MKYLWRARLAPDTTQFQRLLDLQLMFAAACNMLSADVAQTRMWHRVSLHHRAYKSLRARFPELGAQLACNAIYAVSKMARLIYQDPRSPVNAKRKAEGPLPQLHFDGRAPVYFDRHTLSIKDRKVSLYTLDGRMRFALTSSEIIAAWLLRSRLMEVLLVRDAGNAFSLLFVIEASEPPGVDVVMPVPANGVVCGDEAVASRVGVRTPPPSTWVWPQHVAVEEAA